MNFVDKDGTTKVYIPVHPWQFLSSIVYTPFQVRIDCIHLDRNSGMSYQQKISCFVHCFYLLYLSNVLRMLIGLKNPNIFNVGLCSVDPDQHSSRD